MTTHERMCKDNPNNKHKCFNDCRFLVGTEKEAVDSRTSRYYDFTCTKHNKTLYSYKLEYSKTKLESRKKLYKDRGEELARMPLKCIYYEVETFDEIFYENE